MLSHLPKPISPRAHRRFDQLALPGIVALALFMRGKNRRAAAIIGAAALAEGSAQFTTDYPPPVALGWMDFREHNRMAVLHGALIAAAACVVPGLSRGERGLILGLSAIPMALAALSDTSEAAREQALRKESQRR